MTRFGLAVVLGGALIAAGCGGADHGQVVEEAVQVPTETTVEVVLATAVGDIVIELYPSRAPITVENFLAYVEGGYFDGAAFYRVVRPDNNNGTETMQLIQGGLAAQAMATGDVEWTAPLDPIAHEHTEMTGIRHERGVISMARMAPGTATSEFFILVTDAPELDFGGMRNPDGQGFACFGRVIEGVEVVEGIHGHQSTVPVEIEVLTGQILNEPVAITSVRRR